MIDSHCHLTDPRLHSQLPAVLHRALAANVARMLTVGTQLDDAHAALSLCNQHPNLRLAAAIHPNHVDEQSLNQLPQFLPFYKNPLVLAVGEIGLDYFHQFAPRDLQQKLFEAQLQIAKNFSKPVIIHAREAIDDTLAILKNHPAVPAIFHCFTGSIDQARRILNQNHHLGLDGPVTYKNNNHLREVAAFTPADRLLIETDAPYLTPEPMRKQKTNEPALVHYVAQVVAQAKNTTLDEIDRQTTAATEAFFRWPALPLH